MKSGSGTVQRAQQTDAALARKDRAIAARQIRPDRGAAGRSTCSPPNAPRRSRNSITPARSKQQAALNLSYTEITAPVEGTVGARTLRVGQFVQAGTQLMAVVPLDAVYVVANFKETQLTHVRNGQPVEIRIDSFHGTRLKGHVDSLSPASGLEFALLPPDNATGNFTKIVQRVPVKIVLDDHSLTGLLRPGMSAEPTVNTKATVVAEREADRRLAASASARTAASDLPAGSEAWRIILPLLRDYQPPFNASASEREETSMTALQTTIDAARHRRQRPLVRTRRRRSPRSRQEPGSRCSAPRSAPSWRCSTSRSSTPRWPTSRARSAPASTTAAGSRPPI